MERARFIEHEGLRILFQDFSGVETTPEALRVIAAAKEFFDGQKLEPASIRVLTLITGSRFDQEVIEALKQLALHQKAAAVAGAVVGLSPLQRIVFRLIKSFARGRLAAFDSVEEGKEWLVRQRPLPRPDR